MRVLLANLTNLEIAAHLESSDTVQLLCVVDEQPERPSAQPTASQRHGESANEKGARP